MTLFVNIKTRLLNLTVLIAFVAAVEYWLGWGTLLASWTLLPPTLVVSAASAHIASYGVRAARIYWAESAIPRGRYLDCLRLLLINNSINILLPMRAGEASFPILMRRWFGVDAARATGTLLWLRLLDLHVLAAIGVVCAGHGWLIAATELTLVLAGLAVLLPVAVFALRAPLQSRLARRTDRLSLIGARLLGGMPARTPLLLKDLALTWTAWIIKLAALASVFAALSGLPATLATLGVIGGDLSTVLPLHTPGGFGSYEAGVLALVAPAEGLNATLAAAAVNLHLFVLALALGAGGLAWMTAPPRLRDNRS